ncbi:MAG: hypothetical protein ACOX89_02105 [Lutispora sp.]|jgi:hypothetical protein|uniref:hypothetical protein n=1 Tax=Lutispora sp. TaxID=2828727 RepID=UPI00356441B0
MMTEEELFIALGVKGEFVPGMGGHGSFFTKGNGYVQLFGGTIISRLRIGIEDPAYKDVVF